MHSTEKIRRTRQLLQVAVFITLICLLALLTASRNVSAQQGGTTRYFYDANGRLRSVISPSGQVAIYNYDAAGNIVAISRQAATPVLISGFSPDNGPIGTQVTITGSGFGATPAENVVEFNGVPARILSATSSQIVAIVPFDATTGPITIIMTTGLGISSTPFSVNSLAPIITGFSPTLATPGTTVTLAGANFDLNPALNSVVFNGPRTAIVNASTLTSIQTKVPSGATSGRISVTTAIGTATSSGDFFVPPSPFTAAKVDDTGRIAFGQNRVVTINQSQHIALMVFDASAGQQFNLRLTNITIPTVNVQIFNPDGTQRLDPPEQFNPEFTGDTTGMVDTLILPTTGTYTIMLFAFGTGSATLSLQPAPPDVTASITPGGSPVTVNIPTPGQNARLTFNGTANQRVSLKATGMTIPVTDFALLKPDGAILTLDFGGQVANRWFKDDRPEFFVTPVVLPVTGTYTVLLNPVNFATGQITVALYDVPPDITRPITPGGPPVSLTLTGPGQIAILTFNGTANQRLSVTATSSVIRGVSFGFLLEPDIRVDNFNEDGDLRNGKEACATNIFLPATGQYRLFISPIDPEFGLDSGDTGPLTVSLFDASNLTAGPLTVGGPAVTVNTTSPSQGILLPVNGSFTAGQTFVVHVTNNTIGCMSLNVATSEGFTVRNFQTCDPSGDFTTSPLRFNSGLRIFINPEKCGRGSITISIAQP